MFLYKLYRFGYGTQKALSGSRSKHVSETSVAIAYPDGGAVQEDIFSRVPALFFITLGNYVVPCAPISYLSSRVRLTYALSG
jgi:hypothetical protein